MKQSFYNLIKMYDTEEKCQDFFIKLRWGNGIECPFCGNKDKLYRFSKGKEKGTFQCGKCVHKFSVRTNSFMGCSRLSYSKWLQAIWYVIDHKRGISSLQLSRNIGVGQNTAWFMIQRIQNIIEPAGNILKGIVEVDEVYIGGKESNKRKDRKTYNSNKIQGDKISVLGMLERGGNLVLKRFAKVNAQNISPLIEEFIDKDAIVNTDESPIYRGALNGRVRQSVNHKAGIYGIGDITTNRIEGVFGHLKKMINGTHTFVTEGHINRYMNMFCFRRNTMLLGKYERISALLSQMNNTRITWDKVSCHGDCGRNIRFKRRVKQYQF